MKFFLMLLCAASFAGLPAYAADEKAPKKDGVKAASPAPETSALEEWRNAENALMKPLNARDQEKLSIIHNKYSIIRVIDIVKKDIGTVVGLCGQKNPSMKDKINARFDAWKGNVEPILKDASKLLEKDISAQKGAAPSDIRAVLKLNDAAYEEGNRSVVKKFVTSEDACNALIDSMDRTENEMISLLEQTLLPESVIIQRSKKMDAEEKAAARKAADKKSSEKKEPAKKEPAKKAE